jgi:glutathionylspermidine synthase
MFEHWNDYYPDLSTILDETSHKFHLEVFRHIMDNEDDIKDEIEDDDNIIYDIDNHKETYEKYKELKNDELKELYREDQNLKTLINFVSDVVSDEDIMNVLDDTLGSTLRSIYSTADNQAMQNKLFKELMEEFVDKFNLKYFSDGKAYKWTDDSKLLFKIGDFYGMEDDGYLYDLSYGYGLDFDIYDIFKVIVAS